MRRRAKHDVVGTDQVARSLGAYADEVVVDHTRPRSNLEDALRVGVEELVSVDIVYANGEDVDACLKAECVIQFALFF